MSKLDDHAARQRGTDMFTQQPSGKLDQHASLGHPADRTLG